MRPIDADAYSAEMKKRQDACIDWLSVTEKGGEMNIRAEQALATFIEASLTLEKQPTVDAVQVVRCKDCEYWRAFKLLWENNNVAWGYGNCSMLGGVWYCDEFCSHGERSAERGTERGGAQ